MQLLCNAFIVTGAPSCLRHCRLIAPFLASHPHLDSGPHLHSGPDAAKASRYYPDHLGHATPPTQSSPPPYSFNTRTASARGGTGGSAGGGVPRASGGIGGRGDDLEECVQEQLQRHAMWEQDEMLGDIEMQVGR